MQSTRLYTRISAVEVRRQMISKVIGSIDHTTTLFMFKIIEFTLEFQITKNLENWEYYRNLGQKDLSKCYH